MGASSNVAGSAGFECVVTRVFDAPRDRVFKAWTDPEQRVKWFGPTGFTATIIENDVRPGGAYDFHMRGPNYDEHWRGVYREVITPERLVFTWGPWLRASTGDTLVTVTFEDLGGKTRLTLRHATFPTEAMRDDHARGWNSTLDRLAEVLQVRHG